MKECDIGGGVKNTLKYSDLSYIFSWGQTPTPRSMPMVIANSTQALMTISVEELSLLTDVTGALSE